MIHSTPTIILLGRIRKSPNGLPFPLEICFATTRKNHPVISTNADTVDAALRLRCLSKYILYSIDLGPRVVVIISSQLALLKPRSSRSWCRGGTDASGAFRVQFLPHLLDPGLVEKVPGEIRGILLRYGQAGVTGESPATATKCFVTF